MNVEWKRFQFILCMIVLVVQSPCISVFMLSFFCFLALICCICAVRDTKKVSDHVIATVHVPDLIADSIVDLFADLNADSNVDSNVDSKIDSSIDSDSKIDSDSSIDSNSSIDSDSDSLSPHLFPGTYLMHQSNDLSSVTLFTVQSETPLVFELITSNGSEERVYRYFGDNTMYALVKGNWECSLTKIEEKNNVKKHENGFSFWIAGKKFTLVVEKGKPVTLAGFVVEKYTPITSFRANLPKLDRKKECVPLKLKRIAAVKGANVVSNDCKFSNAVYVMHNIYFGSFSYASVKCNAETTNGDYFGICSGALEWGASRYFVFSGSNNAGDWEADMEAVSVMNTEVGINMRVHSGFNDKFYQWKPYIDAEIDLNQCQGLSVIMGHSLGGAVARLTALYMKGKGCNVKVITAGEPAAFINPSSNQNLVALAADDIRFQNFETYTGNCNTLRPNLRDPIANAAGSVGYEHISKPTVNNFWSEAKFKWPTCRDKTVYNTIMPTVTPIIGDVDIELHLTDTYWNFVLETHCK